MHLTVVKQHLERAKVEVRRSVLLAVASTVVARAGGGTAVTRGALSSLLVR